MEQQEEVIQKLQEWAEHKPQVRAMLLTSTRANPNASIDIFSDYDVVLVLEDIHPFVEDRTWLQDFGQVLVAYWDPIHLAQTMVSSMQPTSSSMQMVSKLISFSGPSSYSAELLRSRYCQPTWMLDILSCSTKTT